jgi:hypothetical protein
MKGDRMSKPKKIAMTEKVYESLEQWKKDFLPNAVKNEHLLFNKNNDDQKIKCNPAEIVHNKEPLSFIDS